MDYCQPVFCSYTHKWLFLSFVSFFLLPIASCVCPSSTKNRPCSLVSQCESERRNKTHCSCHFFSLFLFRRKFWFVIRAGNISWFKSYQGGNVLYLNGLGFIKLVFSLSLSLSLSLSSRLCRTKSTTQSPLFRTSATLYSASE